MFEIKQKLYMLRKPIEKLFLTLPLEGAEMSAFIWSSKKE